MQCSHVNSTYFIIKLGIIQTSSGALIAATVSVDTHACSNVMNHGFQMGPSFSICMICYDIGTKSHCWLSKLNEQKMAYPTKLYEFDI